jgi:hypothetical protein
MEMDYNFDWQLTNTEHLTDEQLSQVQYGIEIRAYTCQRRIETEEFDGTAESILGDSVNVIVDAIDEAYVTEVEIDEDSVNITLDCSGVIVNYEIC